MKIFFINCDGGGFADHLEIPTGMTVSELFAREVEGDPRGYLIRVNRQAAPREQVLQEGDRVTITPQKIHGA